jgi:hypothetical protein
MYKLINDRLPQKLMKYKLVLYVNPYSRRTHTLVAPYVHHPTPRPRLPLLFGLKIMNLIPHVLYTVANMASFKDKLRDSVAYYHVRL